MPDVQETKSRLADETVGSGKPGYHFIAPKGWMNDPCAPGYDKETGLYHLFYQWNPDSHEWDHISWGQARSRDLVHWEHVSDRPVIVPDQPYDSQGIFTGCFYPSGPSGEKDRLSIFYTSVNHLPIHWTTPHKRGCESMALITSVDQGKSWQKHPDNPVLAEEPPDLHVTGFRDPFVAPWPALDRARSSKPSLYGLISGGVHSDGPKTFLYAIAPSDLTTWTYLYPLVVDVPSNHRPGGRWGGDFGTNWECTNFLSLNGPDGTTRDVVIAGSEGGVEQSQITKYHECHPNAPRRSPSYANWFFGSLHLVKGDMRLDISTSGLLDWGLFYAANHFQAADGRKLMWGWIKEEDLDDATLASRGWTGCLGIVREVYLQTYENVIGGLRSSLKDIGSVDTKATEVGSQISTLGIRPFAEAEQMRQPGLISWASEALDSATRLCVASTPLTSEIKTTLKLQEDTRSVSLAVRHDKDQTIRTVITFDCEAEEISVDRSRSTSRDDINTAQEVGSFTLFRLHDPMTGSSKIEPLELDVFLDHDVLEVFANGRFALATRVYTDADVTGISISSDGPVMVEVLDIWPLETVRSDAKSQE